MSGLSEFWRGLPRWAHWAGIAALIVVVFFGIISPALNFIDSYSSRASALESNIARDKELADATSEDGRLIEVGRQSFGQPLLPTDKAASAETLHRVVDRILKEHGVDDAKISEHKAQLKNDLLAGVIGGGTTVDRVTIDVAFETDATTALDILAALEEAPEVTTLARVKIDKQSVRGSTGSTEDAQSVRVTLAPEMWIVPQGGSGGGE